MEFRRRKWKVFFIFAKNYYKFMDIDFLQRKLMLSLCVYDRERASSYLCTFDIYSSSQFVYCHQYSVAKNDFFFSSIFCSSCIVFMSLMCTLFPSHFNYFRRLPFCARTRGTQKRFKYWVWTECRAKKNSRLKMESWPGGKLFFE